jgi:5-methylcytosine-specific restriction endonuclease McrA
MNKKKYQLNWIKTRRDEFIKSKGNCCNICNNVNNLEVDHINPILKTMNPSNIWSRKLEIRQKELNNCQVLCKECHMKKTIEHRTKYKTIEEKLEANKQAKKDSNKKIRILIKNLGITRKEYYGELTLEARALIRNQLVD